MFGNKKNEDIIVSELRYRRLFETAQDGILLVSFEDGMIIDVNKYLIDLIGYSKEDFLGKHLWDVGVFKDIVASKDNYLTLQTKGYVRFEDLPLETKDGRKIDVEFVANSYDVGNEKIIQCNIRNITDRRIAELKLSSSLSRLEDVQRIANIGDWEANLTTGELHWSQLIFDIFGLDSKTFKPTVEAFYNAVHPDDKIRVAESEKLSEQTGLHDIIHRIIRPNGEVRFVREIAKRFKNNDGRLVMLRGIVQDLTESALEAEKLARSVKKVNEMNNFFTGRELRMAELKEKIKVCEKELVELRAKIKNK